MIDFAAFGDELEKIAREKRATVPLIVPAYFVPSGASKKPETKYEKARDAFLVGARGALTGASIAGLASALKGSAPSRGLTATLAGAGVLASVADKAYRTRAEKKRKVEKKAMVVHQPRLDPMKFMKVTPGRLLKGSKATGQLGVSRAGVPAPDGKIPFVGNPRPGQAGRIPT